MIPKAIFTFYMSRLHVKGEDCFSGPTADTPCMGPVLEGQLSLKVEDIDIWIFAEVIDVINPVNRWHQR